MSAFTNHIMTLSETARSRLAQDAVVGQYVDLSLPIPVPFHGTGEIRMFIIGQDPTVTDPARRKAITMTLTLNEPRSPLRRFVTKVCDELGISLDENVYATNAAKNFFKDKPSDLLKNKRIDVLAGSNAYWLPVLCTELDSFPSAAVISLGEDVLSMLVNLNTQRKMSAYWGHHPKWRDNLLKPFHAIERSASTVDRKIFPFIHQPSLRGWAGPFYTSRWDDYIAFIKEDLKHGNSH